MPNRLHCYLGTQVEREWAKQCRDQKKNMRPVTAHLHVNLDCIHRMVGVDGRQEAV